MRVVALDSPPAPGPVSRKRSHRSRSTSTTPKD